MAKTTSKSATVLNRKSEFLRANPQHKELGTACSAFNIFRTSMIADARKRLDAASIKVNAPEIQKLVTSDWNNLSTAKKDAFTKQAEANRLKMKALIVAWKATLPRKVRVAGARIAPDLPNGFVMIAETATTRKHYLDEDADLVVFSRPFSIADGKAQLAVKPKAKKDAAEQPKAKKAKI